jgi:hypothetical protein
MPLPREVPWIARALRKYNIEVFHLFLGPTNYFMMSWQALLQFYPCQQKLSLMFRNAHGCHIVPGLQGNTKELIIHGIELTDEKLSTAMRLGLGNNSTLELYLLSINGHPAVMIFVCGGLFFPLTTSRSCIWI